MNCAYNCEVRLKNDVFLATNSRTELDIHALAIRKPMVGSEDALDDRRMRVMYWSKA